MQDIMTVEIKRSDKIQTLLAADRVVHILFFCMSNITAELILLVHVIRVT